MVAPNYNLAKTLRDAYRVCDVRALSLENIDRYYIPFESRQNAISDVNGKLAVTEPGNLALFCSLVILAAAKVQNWLESPSTSKRTF